MNSPPHYPPAPLDVWLYFIIQHSLLDIRYIIKAWGDCECVEFAFTPADAPKTRPLLPVTFSATGEKRRMRRTSRLEIDDGWVVELTGPAAVKGG